MAEFYDQLNTIEDVQALIAQGQRESDVLEYKEVPQSGADGNNMEISKDVSAMANALGGVIIYGVACDPKDKGRPVSIAESLSPKICDTFDQTVAANVRPSIQGMRRKLIPETTGPRAMIVGVPASDDRPHQDLRLKKYFRRYGSHNLPMDHDLIATLFGRRLGPVVDLSIKVLEPVGLFPPGSPHVANVQLRLLAINSGKKIGKDVLVIAYFPRAELVTVAESRHPVGNIDELVSEYQARQINLPGALHPTLVNSIAEFTLRITKRFIEEHANEPLIKWAIYADEMLPRRGEATMDQLELRLITSAETGSGP